MHRPRIRIDRMQDKLVQMTSRDDSRRVRVAQGGRKARRKEEKHLYQVCRCQGRTAVMRCAARLRGSDATTIAQITCGGTKVHGGQRDDEGQYDWGDVGMGASE